MWDIVTISVWFWGDNVHGHQESGWGLHFSSVEAYLVCYGDRKKWEIFFCFFFPSSHQRLIKTSDYFSFKWPHRGTFPIDYFSIRQKLFQIQLHHYWRVTWFRASVSLCMGTFSLFWRHWGEGQRRGVTKCLEQHLQCIHTLAIGITVIISIMPSGILHLF